MNAQTFTSRARRDAGEMPAFSAALHGRLCEAVGKKAADGSAPAGSAGGVLLSARPAAVESAWTDSMTTTVSTAAGDVRPVGLPGAASPWRIGDRRTDRWRPLLAVAATLGLIATLGIVLQHFGGAAAVTAGQIDPPAGPDIPRTGSSGPAVAPPSDAIGPSQPIGPSSPQLTLPMASLTDVPTSLAELRRPFVQHLEERQYALLDRDAQTFAVYLIGQFPGDDAR